MRFSGNYLLFPSYDGAKIRAWVTDVNISVEKTETFEMLSRKERSHRVDISVALSLRATLFIFDIIIVSHEQRVKLFKSF